MSSLLRDYDFLLPGDRIAQRPAEPRDSARLLLLDRRTGATAHRVVRDLPDLLRPGDLLVVNRSKVIPARVHGRRASGARVEILLHRPTESATVWEALARPGGRLKPGEELLMPKDRSWTFLGFQEGVARVDTKLDPSALHAYLEEAGETPLPPYIAPDESLRERYQTVYAAEPGSVAAPTAGLHFTPELLAELERRGIERAEVILHVGLGTFQPVTTPDVTQHVMHAEAYEVPTAAAMAVNAALAEGRRVIAVGTTSARVLESAVRSDDRGTRVIAGAGETRIFIRPGFSFRVLSGLLTNFHLPQSTLLMLVSAFAGREHVLAAYEEAVRSGYRFYSFGDAMLIADEAIAIS